MDKIWLEVEIVTSSEAAEAVTGILYNTGVHGVAILDAQDIKEKKESNDGFDWVEVDFLDRVEGAVIKAYYKEDEKFNGYLQYIKESLMNLDKFGFDKGEGTVTVKRVDEEDWENNWKVYYKTTRVGKNIIIKPVWEKYDKAEGEVIVELDPGMAFGTGTHETTRLCIQALEKYVDSNSTVFDIGTGSGILSITAGKLKAKKVVGVDLDPVAVDSARENVKLNNLDNIEILYGNLMDVVEGKANIVVANILADIIILLSDDVKKFIEKGGYFISSGIILSRKDDVINKLEQLGFTIEEVNTDGEWCCIIAKA